MSVDAPDTPSLADLWQRAARRWGEKGTAVRVTFNGREYCVTAVRTTTTGTGADDVATAIAASAPEALRKLGERLAP